MLEPSVLLLVWLLRHARLGAFPIGDLLGNWVTFCEASMRQKPHMAHATLRLMQSLQKLFHKPSSLRKSVFSLVRHDLYVTLGKLTKT